MHIIAEGEKQEIMYLKGGGENLIAIKRWIAIQREIFLL